MMLVFLLLPQRINYVFKIKSDMRIWTKLILSADEKKDN